MIGWIGCCTGAVAQRNHLYNDTCLFPVYASLANSLHQVIPILHLGDSHVQADMLPDAVRKGFQQQFGDAGRGWVFPYSLAGTNGPDSYRWSSSVKWQDSRIIDRNLVQWPGPGGIVISKPPGAARLTYSSPSGFSCLRVFFEGTGEIQAVHGNALISVQQATSGVREVKICEDSILNAMHIAFPDITRFYGAIAENGSSGVMYHAIGINGAQFQHYNQFDGRITGAQAAILNPELIIISLGTNEAFGAVSEAQLKAEMEKTVAVLQEGAPQARFLFTTPPSGMMKKRAVPYRKKGSKRTYYRTTYVRVTQAAIIRDAIVSFCREQGFAWWDLYEAMKSDSRFSRGWSKDRIHFNAYGYTLQGGLLYDAFDESYRQWKKEHNKP